MNQGEAGPSVHRSATCFVPASVNVTRSINQNTMCDTKHHQLEEKRNARVSESFGKVGKLGLKKQSDLATQLTTGAQVE